MRRVTNTNLLKALTEHFLGNVPLRHLLNVKPPFMSGRKSAFNEVNDWALDEVWRFDFVVVAV